MNTITVDFTAPTGKIKPMHAVNNGPLKYREDQTRHNYNTYKEARIPFARNHDAAFCAEYGGSHTVDINAIFPDFSADPYDPASYDFVLTDEYLERTMSCGTEIFYRLGSKIEHDIKKYGTLPPPDFKKWAVVCEHIIRHMNEGWANGHYWNILYWEIWNEPDLDPDDSDNKRCWGGTQAQFFELYEIAARHLKGCFPKLKIGGPALAGNYSWADAFLKYMSEHGIALDFFSWHIYCTTPEAMNERIHAYRSLLDRHGYTETESILNEWNYVRGWSDEFIYSIKTIIGIKGAAFTASCILDAQNAPLDMLMYYDARPGVFNGLWDIYTMEPLKGYYPFVMFSELYGIGSAVRVDNTVDKLRAAAAGNATEQAVMISHYNDNDSSSESEEFELVLNGALSDRVSVEVVDEARTMEKTEYVLNNGHLTLSMPKNSFLLVKSL